VLEVAVTEQIDPATGYVFDLKQLSDVICRRVIQDVDHRNLNTDVPWLAGRIPTAENLAVAFWERIRSELPERTLALVRLWETDKNWVEIRDPS
jgi:6-pyruvoyltetrahydropterin/6-carboxytetrahydropterin synthase